MVTRAKLNVKRRRRRILWISVVAVAVTLVVVVSALLVLQQDTGPSASLIGLPISPAISGYLTGVSDSTLSAVGSGRQVVAPTAISGPPLTKDGKPEVFYAGGEYCPFCAVERWSMIIALSRFGSFSNLQYMLSTATDVFPNTPTFTFRNAEYSSPYISFVGVEQYDRAHTITQPLTSDQQALVSQYDPQGSIPFIDIGNSYSIIGAQVTSVDIIRVGNWTQVASQLDNQSSTVAKNLDAAANYLISAICKVDGGKPSSVCGQSYAVLPVSYHVPQTSLQESAQTFVAMREEHRWTI
jgi:hypothetical protein